MRSTIDKAGRVVIPAEVRRQALLEPGTPLEIFFEDGVVKIVRDVAPPEVRREGHFLRVRPVVPQDELPELDIAQLVRNERDRWPF